MRQLIQIATILLTAVAAPALAELPAVPVPPENPITEAKRVLGKILFWDEQLSSDDTVACGTCHLPAAGGADPRAAVHPGAVPGSVDDVAGSPGIRRLDNQGRPVEDPVFGSNPQVTPRTAPSVFGALWANELFWDGRAGGKLIDPGTGETVIAAGAALENQALATLLNDAEMAKEGRTWQELNVKLERVGPLALADQWPADVKEAIASRPTYPELFRAAFGDSAITATRIVMAIATYQRTLVPDQSPWDLYLAGDEEALGLLERYGWQSFQAERCQNCHTPPLFTNNDFINIGLRRSEYDAGRAGVTENPEDAGDMKVPSLRNIGLRSRFMHTGEFRTLGEAINFYRNGASLPEVDEIPDAGAYTFSLSLQTAADLQSFLANALTDPRVAAQTYPFDRPRLASER
ncbi:MAG TPA: cytochrome c peroxidase [Gammaproteobacteria bacterium]